MLDRLASIRAGASSDNSAIPWQGEGHYRRCVAARGADRDAGTVPADAESVHLVSARTSVELHQTKVDDLCGFSFPNLPHGAYHIHVFDKENALIASQEIEVQSDRFDIEL